MSVNGRPTCSELYDYKQVEFWARKLTSTCVFLSIKSRLHVAGKTLEKTYSALFCFALRFSIISEVGPAVTRIVREAVPYLKQPEI